MVASLTNSDDLADYFDENMQSEMKFGSHKQSFLPKSAFDAAITRDVIRDILLRDDKLVMGAEEREAFVNRVYELGRKLFAICIHCDLSLTHLKALLDDGITDKRLPIKIDDTGSLKHKRKFKTSFFPNQCCFNVAYFAMDAMQNFGDGTSIPIHYQANRSSSSWLGKGSFGDVWRVMIHPDHRGFSSGANGQDYFAMKVTDQGPYEQREQNFHREMAIAGLKHPHLAKCLTSFTFGNQYHMIYELANCDLEAFMQENQNPSSISGLTELSVARQMYGLAAALKLVHDQGVAQPEPGRLNVQRENGGKTGYIHDIKPENILVYVYQGNLHWFRLSDFSCAKVVDWLVIVSGVNGKRESQKTQSSSGTPIYRAPECFNEKKTSRPYDLWSLGCVYLELLVWFTEGLDGLNAFRESRMAPTVQDGATYEGFFCIDNDVTYLRKPVTEKIEKLQHTCTGELQAIANIIPDLLRIEPKSRPSAAKLVDQLRHLHDDFDPTPSAREPATSRSPFMVAESDSDSDFGGMLIVTNPT